jgi:hypothetical protein
MFTNVGIHILYSTHHVANVSSQAALRYVAKCKLMGGDWVKWNSMTEREEFLHLEQSRSDQFTRSWELVSSRSVSDEGDENDSGKNLKGTDSGKNLKGTDSGKNLLGTDSGKNLEGTDSGKNLAGHRQQRKRAKEKEGGEEKDLKKARKQVDVLLGKATSLRQKYYFVTGSCAALKQQVQNDEALRYYKMQVELWGFALAVCATPCFFICELRPTLTWPCAH